MSLSPLRLLPLAYVLLLLVFLDYYFKKRDEFYKEYLLYKEFKLLLKNHKAQSKAELSEEWIRNKLSSLGLSVGSIKLLESGYEVVIPEVKGALLSDLVYSIESEGISIVKLKAVDNTGNALFRVEMVLR